MRFPPPQALGGLRVVSLEKLRVAAMSLDITRCQLRSSHQHSRRCPQQGPSENESVCNESFRSATRPRPSLPCHAGPLECRAAAHTDCSGCSACLELTNSCHVTQMGAAGHPAKGSQSSSSPSTLACLPTFSPKPALGCWQLPKMSPHEGSNLAPRAGCDRPPLSPNSNYEIFNCSNISIR